MVIFPQIRKIRKQFTVVIYQNWVFNVLRTMVINPKNILNNCPGPILASNDNPTTMTIIFGSRATRLAYNMLWVALKSLKVINLALKDTLSYVNIQVYSLHLQQMGEVTDDWCQLVCMEFFGPRFTTKEGTQILNPFMDFFLLGWSCCTWWQQKLLPINPF